MQNAVVIGYGYSGRCFHSYLIGLEPGLNLYGISTHSHKEEVAADHPDVVIFDGLDEVVADDDVDLVVLATPHDTHHDLAIQAMEGGKHVVTDKIMCMNAAEAEEMIQVAQRNDVMLSVFHNRRWDWDYLTVKKVIADGLLGEPYLFEAAITHYGPPRGWRGVKARSGGIFYDWPAHFVDQALDIVDAPVASVFCDVVERDIWDIDIGNYGKLLIKFANGVRYQIDISNTCALDKPRWFVVGDKGALVKTGIDPQEDPMREQRIEEAEQDPEHYARVRTYAHGDPENLVIESVRGSWKSYYRNIAEVLNEGAELAVKPQEVLAAMRVFDAAMRSAKEGETVMLA